MKAIWFSYLWTSCFWRRSPFSGFSSSAWSFCLDFCNSFLRLLHSCLSFSRSCSRLCTFRSLLSFCISQVDWVQFRFFITAKMTSKTIRFQFQFKECYSVCKVSPQPAHTLQKCYPVHSEETAVYDNREIVVLVKLAEKRSTFWTLIRQPYFPGMHWRFYIKKKELTALKGTRNTKPK